MPNEEVLSFSHRGKFIPHDEVVRWVRGVVENDASWGSEPVTGDFLDIQEVLLSHESD